MVATTRAQKRRRAREDATETAEAAAEAAAATAKRRARQLATPEPNIRQTTAKARPKSKLTQTQTQQKQRRQKKQVQHQEKQMEPEMISDVTEDSGLCQSLKQLIARHGAKTEFDHLLLALHCLMVEAGFVAVSSRLEEAGGAVSRSEVSRPSNFALPRHVAEKLPEAFSASIVYAHRPPGFVLLKVVNAGILAVCHCGVAATASDQPAAVASGYFAIRRHIELGTGGSGSVRMSAMAELARSFKNTIAGSAKSSLAYACGLPPPGLPSLPTELIHRILRCSDFRSMCRLSQVNRQLLAVSSDNAVWRSQMRREFSHTLHNQRAHAQEARGQSVDYREAFRAAHEERSRTARALARRGSLELMPSAQVPSPQRLEAARAMRAHGFVMSRERNETGARRDETRRHSLSLLPFEEPPELFHSPGGGLGGSELFLMQTSDSGRLWSSFAHFQYSQ